MFELGNEARSSVYRMRAHTLQTVMHICTTFHKGRAEHTLRVYIYTQKRRARQVIHTISSIQLITFFSLHISYYYYLDFFFFYFITKEFQKVLYYFPQLIQTYRDFFSMLGKYHTHYIQPDLQFIPYKCSFYIVVEITIP